MNISDWEEYYKDNEIKSMRWYLKVLDHDLADALKKYDLHTGKTYDVCTGPGTQAIALAKLGFEVTAADISETAISKATELAVKEGATINFVKNDMTRNSLSGGFDFATDRGCFHVLENEDRAKYVSGMDELLKPGGYLFLKCFSHKQPGEDGPYRLTPEEIRETFGGNFKVLEINDSEFRGEHKPNPKALFCVLRKD